MQIPEPIRAKPLTSWLALAVGAVAVGASAVGAQAIWALASARLSVKSGRDDSLEIDDLTRDELQRVLAQASDSERPQLLAGRSVGLYFEKPSLRTRRPARLGNGDAVGDDDEAAHVFNGQCSSSSTAIRRS